MRTADLPAAFRTLRRVSASFEDPYVTQEADRGDPFRVLISCILSLRTRDETTAAASSRLFARADAPGTMRRLPARTLEKLIYPVGFYRTKARQILEICRRLDDELGGRVPDEIAMLLELPGVGRKTANLVVTMGYGKAGICVDTHVHRITNRWGYVRTDTPEKTEMALRAKLPRRYWISINDLLVTWGRNVCHPISPRCSACGLAAMCARVGVSRSR